MSTITNWLLEEQLCWSSYIGLWLSVLGTPTELYSGQSTE
jgi:hypothetical protein